MNIYIDLTSYSKNFSYKNKIIILSWYELSNFKLTKNNTKINIKNPYNCKLLYL